MIALILAASALLFALVGSGLLEPSDDQAPTDDIGQDMLTMVAISLSV